MISLLKYIWSGIKSLGAMTLKLWHAIWNVLTSLVTWVVSVIYYLLDQAWDWCSDRIADFFSLASDITGDVGTTSFQLPPLAQHLAGVFSLPLAIECLGVLLLAFVTARLLRLAMVPVRAVLELL